MKRLKSVYFSPSLLLHILKAEEIQVRTRNFTEVSKPDVPIPMTATVHSARYDPVRDCIVMTIEDDSFPEVPLLEPIPEHCQVWQRLTQDD